MKCPTCNTNITFNTNNSTCSNGHDFTTKNGVHQIMTPSKKSSIINYLNAFEESRSAYIHEINPDNFKRLPYVNYDKGLWKLRQLDIKIIKANMPVKKAKALEIGSWNGWLSNQLSSMGFETTAVDIFTHELDGMGAKKYYPNDWTCIQMDMNNLSILDEKYDLIILNRCMNYLDDLKHSIQELKSLLSASGVLIITGLTYHRNVQETKDKLREAERLFSEKYNIPFRVTNYKGFLEKSDLKLLRSLDLQTKIYPGLRVKSLLAYFFPKKPKYYYGLYIRKNN